MQASTVELIACDEGLGMQAGVCNEDYKLELSGQVHGSATFVSACKLGDN